jgi:integrase
MATKAQKSTQTKNDYITRSISLQRKALRDITRLFGKPPASELNKAKINGKSYETLNIKETVEFACQFWAGSVRKNTWRYYRSALNHYANTLYENNALSAPDLSAVKKLLSETQGSDIKYNRTSSQKKKYLPDDELKLLSSELEKSRSKYAKALHAWLYVNCLVGLRPCEWKQTEIVIMRNKEALLVHNAKTTNGRSHGKTRAITLEHFSDHQRRLVSRFSTFMRKKHESGDFDSTYEGCRRLLQGLNKRLWKHRKKNVTLYSSRHQFSADMKRSGSSLVEIAYLMGHHSTDTSTSHYGKRRYGKSVVTPYIDPTLTANIAKKFKPFSFENKPKAPKTPKLTM